MAVFHTSHAQDIDHVLGDLLIQLKADADIKALSKDLQFYNSEPTKLEVVAQISRPMNIWRLHFDQNTIHERRFLNFLKDHPLIETVQVNHLLKMRETVPDDSFFSEQWQYINDGSNGGTVDADMDADQAWDITTGGVTIQGDTIVVAVLDDGIDLNHQDFGDNLWINHAEIPNNGLDDDNNGYVDDYRGWNVALNNDNISGGGHGTPVAGIVGAQGNNGIGVTGVNWNVKLMVIKNSSNLNEAAVLAAYTYALESRILYNDTDGAEGAFVVSTNASWGINGGDPADAPLWCAFYDTLGMAGIISCGATINADENVDEFGDLPTACPSDFLISVTNTNRLDEKDANAGYGATTIDLGAHGADVYTTASNNSYSEFFGTSGSTPHVTGAVALLYSAPCENISALAKTDPAAAAAQVRQYIFEGVDPNTSLQGITTTGGRLNIFNSLNVLMSNCGPCPSAYNIEVTDLTDTNANLVWTAGINSNTSTLRWREVDSPTWNEVINASSPFALTNLTACTTYEFQIDAICDNENSGYTESLIFETDGCCEAPAGIEVSMITFNTTQINWSSVLAAQSYNLMLNGPSGNTTFTGITTNSFQLMDLEPCTNYSFSIQTVCANEVTEFSPPINFMTFGCGACTDFVYCTSTGEDANFEWIAAVEIADLDNSSGSDGGYGNYTGTIANVMTFNTYSVSLTPDFQANNFDEYFRIWIDYNHDGEFDPVSELAFDSEIASDETVTGTITIPGDATFGLTRLRVGMEWEGNTGEESPEACEIIPYGEVEDYCINIIQGMPAGCDKPINLDTINVLDEVATIIWEDFSDDHIDHNIRVKKISDITWTLYPNVVSPYTLTGLEQCSTYEFQIEANCTDGMSTSHFTESFDFPTRCLNPVSELLSDEKIEIRPNPFQNNIYIQLDLLAFGNADFQLINTSGQTIYRQTKEVHSGLQTIEITDLSALPAGIYFLKVLTKEGFHCEKLIKY